MQGTSPHQVVTLNESAVPEILARSESMKSSLFLSEVYPNDICYCLNWVICHGSLRFLSLSVFLDA